MGECVQECLCGWVSVCKSGCERFVLMNVWAQDSSVGVRDVCGVGLRD
jgi:hypothetical protein